LFPNQSDTKQTNRACVHPGKVGNQGKGLIRGKHLKDNNETTFSKSKTLQTAPTAKSQILITGIAFNQVNRPTSPISVKTCGFIYLSGLEMSN